MKALIGSLIFFIIALHVQGAPQPKAQYSSHGYHGNPSSYVRPAPGYGGNPSNHVRPWGYNGHASGYSGHAGGYNGQAGGYMGPPSQHTRPYPADHGMAWGQPVQSPGKVMIDSEGNYQSSEMGQFGSVSYPSSGNVQVLPRTDMFGGHSGHGGHYPREGSVQVLPSNDIDYSGHPGNHIRPWGNSGYGGNPGDHLRPWQGRQGRKVEVLPINGELPPVQQAPLPPMSMSQTPMSMSQTPMSMSHSPMSMPQPPMSLRRPSMAMVQPMNWRKSYQPIPGTGNCYNRCKNRCGYPQYSGCRPSCSNRCNIQPTCGGRMGSLAQPGNFQVSGNTLMCGSRRPLPSLRPTSPWIPGYPNPNLPSSPGYPNPNLPSSPGYPNPNLPSYPPAQTLPHPIKFADEEVEDQESVNASEDNENEEDGASGYTE